MRFWTQIRDTFVSATQRLGRSLSRITEMPVVRDLFIPLSLREAVRTVNREAGDEERTSAAVKRILLEIARAEYAFITASLIIWAILFLAAVVLPIMLHVAWWGCMIYIVCAIAIPPILIFFLAKLRIAFYIVDAPFLAGELTFSKLWRSIKR